MGKNFLGLDGLKHFWSKAKSWIAEQITAEVTAKIAKIVANAPEDLDTLKEIADWISSHADDAAAMNTAISTNTSDIATLKTTVAGKSDTGHTHTKSEITDFPTSLPANGGTATKATQDSNGNNIANTYMPKSGGTFSGSVTFDRGDNNRTTTIDDFGITHSVEIHTETIYPNNYLYPCIQLPNNKDINIDADNITLSTQNGGHTEIGGGNCIIDGDMHVNNIYPVNSIDASIIFSKNKNNGYDIILASPNGIVNIPSTITPRQGDGATVSIGREDGNITIGDTNNNNAGNTIINNDCKMIHDLGVFGEGNFVGPCFFNDDIYVHSKSLFPSGYIPRTYFIERATKDNITAEQKELLRKMFAYQSVSRLIQCYGLLVYRFDSAGKNFGGNVVTVGYFEGDDWLDSNDNISYDDNSTVNFACFGIQEEADDLYICDMYNLSERVMRNRFDSLNYLLVSRLYFTLLEKV